MIATQWHTETFYIEYLHGKIKNIMVTNWDDHVNRIKRCSFISQKTKCYTLSIIVSVPVRLKFWVQVSLLFFRINNLSMATKVIICFKKLKRIYLLFYDPLYYQDCLLHVVNKIFLRSWDWTVIDPSFQTLAYLKYLYFINIFIFFYADNQKTKYNIFLKVIKRKSSHFRILVFREISKTHPEIIFPSKLNRKPKAERNTLKLSYA